jgi:hypothetical protein
VSWNDHLGHQIERQGEWVASRRAGLPIPVIQDQGGGRHPDQDTGCAGTVDEADVSNHSGVTEWLDRSPRAVCHADFDNGLKALGKEPVMTNDPSDPRVLYHYSSAAGGLGIVKSMTLWATDTRQMSDLTEISYAREILARAVQEVRVDGDDPSGVADWVLLIAKGLAESDGGHSAYAACLCPNWDLLSQWIDHGNRGTGFAIGFDRSILYQCAESQGYSLGPLIYEPAEQEAHLAKCLNDLIDKIVPDLMRQNTAIVEMALDTALGLTIAMLLVKNFRFSAEAEWRLMNQTMSPASSPLQKDDVNLWLSSTGEAAITEVVVGPLTPPDHVALMRDLLDRQGLRHVVVRQSELSLRS